MFSKVIRSFVVAAIFAATSLNVSAGYSWYNFSFVTDNGITASGFFDLKDGFVPSTSWQEVTPELGSFNAYLNANGNSGISSGAFTSFSVYNIPVTNGSAAYGIRFTVPTSFVDSSGVTQTRNITFTALDNKDIAVSEFKYSLQYRPLGTNGTPLATITDSQILSHSFTATMVPEIDGDKLPQAVILLGGILLAYRSRKWFKLPHNVAAQAV